MKKQYTVRTAVRADGETKRVWVYESTQHIWNEVHWRIAKSAMLRFADETWRSEKGARIFFSVI